MTLCPSRSPRALVAVLLAVLLSPAATVRADVVDDWTDALLSAIRTNRSTPTRAARQIAMTQLAIFETANGIQRQYRPYFHQPVAPVGASLEAAISTAAYRVLLNLFTNVSIQTNLTPLYESKLAAIPDSPAKANGVAYGQAVAAALIQLRAGDGHDVQVPYVPGSAPGEWRPTPPAFAVGLDPQWPNMKPFAMTSIGQCRTHSPPPLTSSAYAFEFNAVKAIGGLDSTVRTADQTEIALFWADGAGTETPPGHWLHITQIIAKDRQLTVLEKARLQALVGIGVVDASIASWDAKYVYNYWRPVTAIREADTDGNPDTVADPNWTPLVATPPFPEYTSGHSTFSRTSATIIERFFGTTDIPFTSVSDGLPGVKRSFPGPGAAADESGISRIYGGIHFNSGNIAAQAAGFLLGNLVSDNFLQPLTAAQFAHVTHGGQSVTLEIVVEPGRTYAILASVDLENWVEIATVNSPSDRATFTDKNPPGGLRFYKAVAR